MRGKKNACPENYWQLKNIFIETISLCWLGFSELGNNSYSREKLICSDKRRSFDALPSVKELLIDSNEFTKKILSNKCLLTVKKFYNAVQ